MVDRSTATASATATAVSTGGSRGVVRVVAGQVRVIGTHVPVPDVLVELLDYGSHRRLGSVRTAADGSFRIELAAEPESRIWRRRPSACPSLQLLVLTPERSDRTAEDRVLYRSEPRDGVSGDEQFLVELAASALEAAGICSEGAPPGRASAEELRRSVAREAETRAAEEEVIEQKLEARARRRKLFEDKMREPIERELSQVSEDEAKSPHFVARGADIREVQWRSTAADVAKLAPAADEAGVEAHTEPERESSIELSAEDAAALVGDSTEPVEVTEAALEEALGTSLDKPATIARINRAVDACIPGSSLDQCLAELLGIELPVEEAGDGETGDDDEHGDGETEDTDGATGGAAEAGETGDVAGNGVAFDRGRIVAELTDRVTSPEDPVEFGTDLGDLEPAQTVDHISAAIANLTLAPGPADVPAYHDFHDLQIAFEPIWQEALDEAYVEDVAAVFDEIVERGGRPAETRMANLAFVDRSAIEALANELVINSQAGSSSYDSVAGVIMITREEFAVLPPAAQTYLVGIATAIGTHRQTLLEDATAPEFEPKDFDSIFEWMRWRRESASLTTESLKAREKLRLLYSDAEGVVALARRLLLEKQSLEPFRPTHEIVEALKARHHRRLPFRHFAADAKHRSVNFGVLVTYQQIWSPKSYQVGELVNTIPLAPKEVRKYERKITVRRKTAVKEIESAFERRTGETQEKGRIESEILRRATAKTNFDMSSEGNVSYGTGEQAGFSGSTTTKQSFARNVEKHSRAVKKEFNEAVRKATEEVKNEQKTEITTEESFEETTTETGELMNPNDEIPCTFMFYELQRRYQVEERIHQLQSVVFVAQEIPKPGEIDKAWLIRHDWILSRVLLDPSYAPALGYLSTSLISEEAALQEMRRALFEQRKLVEDLKQDLADRRVSSGQRYGALQKQLERSAKKAEGGGGLFGGLKKFVGGVTGLGGVIDGAMDLLGGGDDEMDPASELRERAARDAFDRERREEQDLESRVGGAITTLSRMQEEYTERLAEYLSELGQCHRLIDHVWANILYYMQAIWAHEPRDQQNLRLRNVPVPVFEKDKLKKKYMVHPTKLSVNPASLSIAEHRFDVSVTPGITPPPPPERIETQPLYQVADLNRPLGAWGNYLIFPMFETNPITEYMMEPYVTLAGRDYGVSDPDVVGNMTLDDFAEYVCCLKAHFERQRDEVTAGDDVNPLPDPFEEMKPRLREILKELLERAGPAGRDVVVPMDGLYIEALPGAHSVMERFKHMHRQVDVKKVQAEVREAELENARRAARIAAGDFEDPDIEAKYVFDGDGTASVNPPTPPGP